MMLFIIIACIVITAILVMTQVAIYTAMVSLLAPFFPSFVDNFLPYIWIYFGFMTVGFVSSLILSHYYNNSLSRGLYKLTAGWLGYMLYFFLAACLYAVFNAGPLFFPDFITESFVLSVGWGLFILAFFVATYGLINAQTIRTTHLNFTRDNLPILWKGRRAVFVSDLHLGQIRGSNFAQKIVEHIEKLKPDIVFIGGDLYDGVKVDCDEIIGPLSVLVSSSSINLGVYFIMGNHEEFFSNLEYKKAIEKIGIKILMDEMVVVDDMQIVGVDYKTTVHESQFEDVLKKIKIDSTKTSILLKHVPSHVLVGASKGISLQLSGHTHRAQTFPLGLFPKYIYHGYDYGFKKCDGMKIYTSSGVGTWGPPFRVGTKAEIVSIDFL